ncbi:hypothetical protein H2200_004877 [Cladophialophora chaetospira]|uniref:RecQ-mediated genome instability protein 1 n=1 Tax=Cladophialophora chaetospira TaxID=386627 RepID=A0AA38XDX9_9EURO|nr:hypothetical protein H2200_004877 [Cladophialophora chaetospira]
MPPLHPLHTQVSSALQTRHTIPVNPQWLNTFLTSRGPNPPPLPALVSTAHFRVLASDITTSITPTCGTEAFPQGINDVNVKERQLEASVIVQVLDVIDVSSSKWSQIEAIERVERGEEIRGREVIRTVNGIDDDEGAAATNTASNSSATNSNNNSASKKLSTGPHKLLIQDSKGTKVFAFELEKIPNIAISHSAGATLPAAVRNQAAATNTLVADDPGMFIGCKMLLRPGTLIRRGLAMLTPDKCVVMGGKVDAWDKRWKDERKQRLKALLAEENEAGRG